MYFSKIFSVCSLSTYFGNLKEAPGIDRGRGVTALLQLSHALPVTGRSLVMAYNLITRGACQRFSLWSFSLDWFLTEHLQVFPLFDGESHGCRWRLSFLTIPKSPFLRGKLWNSQRILLGGFIYLPRFFHQKNGGCSHHDIHTCICLSMISLACSFKCFLFPMFNFRSCPQVDLIPKPFHVFGGTKPWRGSSFFWKTPGGEKGMTLTVHPHWGVGNGQRFLKRRRWLPRFFSQFGLWCGAMIAMHIAMVWLS